MDREVGELRGDGQRVGGGWMDREVVGVRGWRDGEAGRVKGNNNGKD